ncbi:MAG: NUDIX domain-containing protein [Bacillota bacterium]
MRRHERSAGGVVVELGETETRVLLIQDRFGRWSFPKGRVEPGESPAEAAVREVAEETGIDGTVLEPLPGLSYAYSEAEGRRVVKSVDMYLIAARGTPRPQPGEALAACWHTWAEAVDLLGYAGLREVLEAARLAVTRHGGRA